MLRSVVFRSVSKQETKLCPRHTIAPRLLSATALSRSAQSTIPSNKIRLQISDRLRIGSLQSSHRISIAGSHRQQQQQQQHAGGYSAPATSHRRFQLGDVTQRPAAAVPCLYRMCVRSVGPSVCAQAYTRACERAMPTTDHPGCGGAIARRRQPAPGSAPPA